MGGLNSKCKKHGHKERTKRRRKSTQRPGHASDGVCVQYDGGHWAFQQKGGSTDETGNPRVDGGCPGSGSDPVYVEKPDDSVVHTSDDGFKERSDVHGQNREALPGEQPDNVLDGKMEEFHFDKSWYFLAERQGTCPSDGQGSSCDEGGADFPAQRRDCLQDPNRSEDFQDDRSRDLSVITNGSGVNRVLEFLYRRGGGFMHGSGGDSVRGEKGSEGSERLTERGLGNCARTNRDAVCVETQTFFAEDSEAGFRDEVILFISWTISCLWWIWAL